MNSDSSIGVSCSVVVVLNGSECQAQQCMSVSILLLCMDRCLYVSVHELCAACAISSPTSSLARNPCLPSFFLSNSHHCHHSSFKFPPRLDCVSNLRLSISYLCFSFLVHIARHSFHQFIPCEVGLLRGDVLMGL